jgi:DNA-binding transcriptional MerR regulator
VYRVKDVKWLEFVIRLKETVMPLEEILEYARLREQGSSTVLERQLC